MTADRAERRAAARRAVAHDFEVLVDDRSFPAELADISAGGLQARVDAVTFDEIRERIDGVRFGRSPPLAVTLRWGFFDGRFGASFKDRLEAGPVVEQVIAARARAAGTAAV